MKTLGNVKGHVIPYVSMILNIAPLLLHSEEVGQLSRDFLDQLNRAILARFLQGFLTQIYIAH